MLHLYWGDGKGKTTAAMGLALRALGHGRRVVILQFLKDGSSGEIEMLRRCGAVVYACPNAKFTWLMTDAERAEARQTNTRTLQTILQGSFDLLVLDEACAACKNDLVEEALLREAAARAEQGAEVVLTGREPAAWMQDAADYSTELRAVKHPYTRGIAGPPPRRTEPVRNQPLRPRPDPLSTKTHRPCPLRSRGSCSSGPSTGGKPPPSP